MTAARARDAEGLQSCSPVVPKLQDHPVAALFPLLEPKGLDELSRDISARGLLVPIVVHEGAILDGRNRYRACELAGVEPVTVPYQGSDPFRDVVSWNLVRRHLNESQRAMVAARLANMPEGRPGKTASIEAVSITQPEAAELLNVARASVQRAAHVLAHAEPEVIAAVDRGELAVSAAAKAHVRHNSGVSEWYTPREIIEAARLVMGGIDVDPASCAAAQEIVGAGAYYTREIDGLAHHWHGRVWMNPPYCQPEIDDFCVKLEAEIGAGHVTQALTLTNNATETLWGQKLLGLASAVCLPKGRIRFWAPGRPEAAPLQGQMLCYIGERRAEFAEKFSSFGVVLAEIGGGR